MTAAYFSLTCNNNFSRCARFGSSQSLKWYGLTTVGCFALSPIIGGALVSLNEHRELRSSEVFMMVSDCVLPIIGGPHREGGVRPRIRTGMPAPASKR